jgi:hypothetical protein
MDIDLSVYGKSSAEAMVGKRKQMSTPQKTSCYIFVRGWSKPTPNCRNIRSKLIRGGQIFLSDSIIVKVVKMNDEVVDQQKLMTAVTGRFYVV